MLRRSKDSWRTKKVALSSPLRLSWYACDRLCAKGWAFRSPKHMYVDWNLLGFMELLVLLRFGTFPFQVHLTPTYFFFRSNKSLHLFKTHCAFLPLFNPNLDFLQAVKVTKSGHHLLHDRAIRVWFYSWVDVTNFFACMFTIRCKSVCDIKPGIDPCPLLQSSTKVLGTTGSNNWKMRW